MCSQSIQTNNNNKKRYSFVIEMLEEHIYSDILKFSLTQ